MIEYVDQMIQGIQNETIWLIEHEPIYTAGVSTDLKELNNTLNILKTDRGGKITYHGPGQRIIYPMLDLNKDIKDVKLYVHKLQIWLINSLHYFGVKAFTIDNRVGIWVKKGPINAKIASIGIKLKKWISYHGIAININPDLKKFDQIRPCGLDNLMTTSLFDLGLNISMIEFDEVLKVEFNKIFL